MTSFPCASRLHRPRGPKFGFEFSGEEVGIELDVEVRLAAIAGDVVSSRRVAFNSDPGARRLLGRCPGYCIPSWVGRHSGLDQIPVPSPIIGLIKICRCDPGAPGEPGYRRGAIDHLAAVGTDQDRVVLPQPAIWDEDCRPRYRKLSPPKSTDRNCTRRAAAGLLVPKCYIELQTSGHRKSGTRRRSSRGRSAPGSAGECSRGKVARRRSPL